jgi:hypothetical protein
MRRLDRLTRCDKCGGMVFRENDAVMLDSLVYKNPLTNLTFSSRHLFPTHDSIGEQLCEGSPSRAAYFGKGNVRNRILQERYRDCILQLIVPHYGRKLWSDWAKLFPLIFVSGDFKGALKFWWSIRP